MVNSHNRPTPYPKIGTFIGHNHHWPEQYPDNFLDQMNKNCKTE